MKKLVATALTAAALLVPASSALADGSDPAGTNPCPSGSIGRVVYHWDPRTDSYRYYKLCIYTGP